MFAKRLNFNPRSPRGLRLFCFSCKASISDFNPRSPRGLRLMQELIQVQKLKISIHAAQEGCDHNFAHLITLPKAFQSTQPKRAATKPRCIIGNHQNISIHAAQEGCDRINIQKRMTHAISIHAAQEGCDMKRYKTIRMKLKFQSTQPKRAATLLSTASAAVSVISIHAAQEGCDVSPGLCTLTFSDFNPRSPRGLRLQAT